MRLEPMGYLTSMELTMNDQARILPDVASGVEAMRAEMARLKAENAKLLAAAQSKLRVKLSEKGAISVSGVGKFPVTLYKSQWQRILCPEIISQIEALYRDASEKA
jgi:hypothetical protein